MFGQNLFDGFVVGQDLYFLCSMFVEQPISADGQSFLAVLCIIRELNNESRTCLLCADCIDRAFAAWFDAAGASPEFQELLVRLLDKNPATRINWQVITQGQRWCRS